MKTSLLIPIAALLIAGFSSVEAHAQTQPDLVVRQVVVTKDASGLFINKVTVGVANECVRSMAGSSYVLITFREDSASTAKAIYYIGNTVRALKGGETQVQTFDVSDKKIGVGRYIYVEADPYKNVAEANEDNNWRSLNPNDGGMPLSPARCSSR